MLQPMQPIGQQQKPGTNIGMPKAPGQQMLPAGAAMQRGILPGGIASNPEDIKAAYGGTPAGQQRLQQSAQQGDYLSAIALAQILEEERERAAAKAMPQEGGRPAPVVDRMRDEAVELRRQDLEEQQAKRLGMEQQRSQGAMAQMVQQAARPPMQGIAQLPAPNVAQPQAMAAGGIVAFAEGDVVEKPTEEEVRPRGANPYIGMKPRAVMEKVASGMVNVDRDEAERRKREEYMRFAGYTPEERAAQEKRIAQLEAYDREMYDPDKLKREGLAAFLMGAANTGNIGETFARAGTSGLNYSNKMRELARQRMEGRQKKAEEFMEAQRGARVKGFEAGAAEGKEALAGQRAGLGAYGDILQADAAAARIGASGGPESKMQQRAAQEVAGDEYINILKSELSDMRKQYQQNTPEYRAKLKEIFEREAAIYKKYPGATPPTAPSLEAPPEAPKEESTGIMTGLSNMWKGISGGVQRLQQGQPAASSSALPPEIPQGSVKIGTSGGNPVYRTPDGKKLVVKP